MTESLHDDILGELMWNRHEWDGKAEVSGRPVDLEVRLLAGQETPLLLAAARQSLRWLQGNEAEVRHALASSYLDEVNQFWNDGDEPITLEEFEGSLALHAARLFGDGVIVLFYDNDLCLFRERWLVAEFNRERKRVKIDLER